jgi:DNA (cytosine-5)-methyltransferase 1
MILTYGELFAGVSGMGLGFDAAGMIGRWRVEIDRAAAGVLARHHPNDILEADVVAFAKWLSRLKKHDPKRFESYLVSVLGGGSPCQDLSVAGLRAGLDGERSGLFRIMVRICRILRPRVVVWENVLGALSSNAGKDFACVIGAFTGCIPDVPDDGWGYGGFARSASSRGWNVAWRVFDSEYFGVPQRRYRVFLVASAGDGSCAEILFEPESVRGDNPPSREAGQSATGTLAARPAGSGGLGTDMDLDGGVIAGTLTSGSGGGRYDKAPMTAVCANVAPTINAAFGEKQGLENQHIDGGGGCSLPAVARTLTTSNQRIDAETETLIPTRQGGFFDDAVAHTLRAEGFDASEDGTGRGTPLVPVAFDTTQITSAENRSQPKAGGPCHPLSAGAHAPAIAFNLRGRDGGAMPEAADAASLRAASGGSSRSYVAFSCKDSGADSGEVAPTLRAMGHAGSHANAGGQVAVAFNWQAAGNQTTLGANTESAATLSKSTTQAVAQIQPFYGSPAPKIAFSGVRRLTPRECERLQGWPDDHTRFRLKVKRVGNDWRIVGDKVIEQADGTRYRQCGNGITATVSAWIAERIVRFTASRKEAAA